MLAIFTGAALFAAEACKPELLKRGSAHDVRQEQTSRRSNPRAHGHAPTTMLEHRAQSRAPAHEPIEEQQNVVAVLHDL